MSTTHRLAAIAIALAASFVAVEAESQALQAVVLDRETKQPVADARVSLISRRRAELDTARTATDGTFSVRAKEGGKFFIHVRRLGYPVEETDAIFLKAGETRVDTLYVQATRTLQKVEVAVSREVFRLFGVTASSLPARAVILPEDLDEIRATARSVADVVQQKGPPYVTVRGVGTGRVCYQIHGGDCALVYLNGQPIPSTTDLPAHDIEAVAVLSPLDAQITLGRNTGVVLLFTRGMLRSASR